MKRTLRSLAALVMLALLVAGCSNAPADTVSSGSTTTVTPTASSTGNTTSSADELAVKFARCMRTNGVSNFPDPDASGAFTIDQIANGSSVNPNSAAFKQAMNTCQDLEPPGFTGSPRSPEQQQAALKFAQCVRDNGVTDFPDPDPNGPLIDTNRIPSAAKPGGMNSLHAAMQQCRDLAASAGVTGGK